MGLRGTINKTWILIIAFDKHFVLNDAIGQTNNYNPFLFAFESDFRGSNWAMHFKAIIRGKK